MREIVVPEGMLEEVYRKMNAETSSGFRGTPLTISHVAVEAALRWLSEHPIVPSEAQWEECCAEWQKSRDPMDSPSMENIYPIWQRRMFLAPEAAIPLGLLGRTFTQAEADAIINHVQISCHGYQKPQSKEKP